MHAFPMALIIEWGAKMVAQRHPRVSGNEMLVLVDSISPPRRIELPATIPTIPDLRAV
jgi:hypothetical protein